MSATPTPLPLLILAAVGLSWVVVRSGIGEPVRLLARVLATLRPFRWASELIQCPGCTGFWAGLGLAGLDLAQAPAETWPSFVTVLAIGFASAASSVLFDSLLQVTTNAAEFVWIMLQTRGLPTSAPPAEEPSGEHAMPGAFGGGNF